MTGACERLRTVLKAVTEGTGVATDELALHLDACDHCRRLFDLGRIDLPKEGFEVLDETARRKMVVALGSARLLAPRRGRWAGLTVAAAGLAVAVGATYFLAVRPGADRVADALVDDHIRYLSHADRNVGGSPATLERYLETYVDFPIELATSPNGRLTGGRRCFVLGRRVALIFYATPDGPASYFIFAADGLRPPGRRCPGTGQLACAGSHGYCLVGWESAGLLHVIVGSREPLLVEMAKAWRSSTAS